MKKLKKHVNIPIGLIDHAFEHSLVKELELFMYLKMSSNGTIKENDTTLKEAALFLRWNYRTVLKYFRRIEELSWISYNRNKRFYYINSLVYLISLLKIGDLRAVLCMPEYFTSFEGFLCGAKIIQGVNKFKFYFEYILPRQVSVSKSKREKTHQLTRLGAVSQKLLSQVEKPEYYGYDLNRIAQDCFCSKAKAVRLKKDAIALGIIKTEHKFRELAKPDYNVDPSKERGYKLGNEELSHRIVKVPFNVTWGGCQVRLGESLGLQNYDKITPQIKIKKLRSYKPKLSKEIREKMKLRRFNSKNRIYDIVQNINTFLEQKNKNG